jgi:hypothetical protein
MAQDGVRVFLLARRLGVEAANVLDAGKALGLDLKTQLSLVSPGQQAALEAYFRERVRAGDIVAPLGVPRGAVPTLDELFAGDDPAKDDVRRDPFGPGSPAEE